MNRLGIALVLASLVAGCGAAAPPRKAAALIVQPPPAAAPALPASPAVVQVAFAGEGTLEAKDEAGGKTRLALERLGVTATTSGDVVETTVEHVFRNDSDAVLEGTLRFPLPDGAILTGLAMEIDGKLMDGELVEREKARKAYEQVVDGMMDPALLEWENGQTFKLRVFPIEAKKDKRVVIRFVAPLHRGDGGLFFAFRPPTSEAALTTEKVSIVVDGKNVGTSGAKARTGEVLVKVGEHAGAEVVTETRSEGAYWLAHVRPRLAGDAPVPGRAQALIVLCDRSRSMLEARGLQTRTLGMLLDGLAAGDQFTVVTGDVRTQALGGLRRPGASEKSAALAFVDRREPDGASDVGLLASAATAHVADARARGLEPVVVYLGDGNATWGETRTSELERIAKDAMNGATMHVVVLGKSADEPAARALAAGTHGRIAHPKTEQEAERAASEIVAARQRRRIEDLHVEGADGAELPLALPEAVYDGDALTVALRVAGDKPAPAAIRLVGIEGGKPFSQAIDLEHAKTARHVARRWAKAKIELLEREGEARKEEIVKTSLEHGVMSRYTSFLVLDSEEAYARFQIARKAKQKQEDAQVSGRDLDGTSTHATVSPDHLQPGDPEVRIPAPADAQSVVVVFPFGETKTASFEPDRSGTSGAWVARFLVDRSTPDGTYEILIRITHRDGRVEILKLPYVVDTLRPNLDVTMMRKADGSFAIRAKQRLTAEEVDAQAPPGPGTVDERKQRWAHVLTDAKRVEVRTPDGQVLSLTHVFLGEFAGTWRPHGTFDAGSKIRVVAVDRALNESVSEIEVPR